MVNRHKFYYPDGRGFVRLGFTGARLMLHGLDLSGVDLARRNGAAKRCLAGLAVFAVMSGFAASSGQAQIKMQGSTAPTVDQRRATTGAKITAEAGAEQDPSGAHDEKRLSDTYQPKGLDLGLFLLLPKLETDETYNSNVYATRDNVKSDFVTTIRPELALRSRFAQHELNVRMMAEKYIYRTYKKDDHLDYQGDVSGRYDVQPGTELTLFTQYFSRHEDRSSPDEAGGVTPTPTHGWITRLGGKQEFGRYVFLTDVTAQRLTYDRVATSSGGTVPNDDRDRWEVEGRLRGSYEMFPGYAAVAQVSANTRRYDDGFDRNGYNRSSRGYRVEGGVGVDLSQLLRGDFLVGYLSQNYEDARLKDPAGLSVRATFNWTPDKLVIVVPSLERVVSETTRAGSSSQIRTTGSVLVRYEAARNILLSSYLSASYSENSGLQVSDWLYEARLRGIYSFSRELFVGAEAVQKLKEAQGETGGYRQTTLMLRLGLQL